MEQQALAILPHLAGKPVPFQAWLEAGCTEADILDTIRQIGGLHVGSWRYFEKAVYRARDARLAAIRPALSDEVRAERVRFALKYAPLGVRYMDWKWLKDWEKNA